MTINSSEELLKTWRNTDLAMHNTIQALREIIAGQIPFQIVHTLRFDQAAFDPLDPERDLNLTEHLNQLFTCLVSYAAVYKLSKEHDVRFPITLNIGARAGFDIEAEEGTIKGECFAAVRTNNNKKLKRDIDRLRDADATRKFLYYYSPNPIDHEEEGIQIISLTMADLNVPAV